jgi:hypothetical protein
MLIDLHRDRSDCYFEAQTLDHLGDVYLAAGEHSAARRTWRHCLDILEQLGHPDADGIRLKLTHK